MLLWKIQKKAIASPSVRTLAGLAVGLVLIGMVFFHYQEGLRWLDAWYFTVITLTTVGYGDFSPQTDLGKVFTVAYVLLGLGIIASLIGMFSSLALETIEEEKAQKKEGSAQK